MRQLQVVHEFTHSMAWDPWFDFKGAAAYSSLSRRTLQEALHDRTDPLPHSHVGARVLIRRSALDAWLDRRRCQKIQAATTLGNADAQGLRIARPQK